MFVEMLVVVAVVFFGGCFVCSVLICEPRKIDLLAASMNVKKCRANFRA